MKKLTLILFLGLTAQTGYSQEEAASLSAGEYTAIADSLEKLQDLEGAKINLEKAHQIRMKAEPKDTLDIIWSYDKLAGVYHNMGDYESARILCARALEMLDPTLDKHPFWLQRFYFKLSDISEAKADYRLALDYIDKALELFEALKDPNQHELSKTLNLKGRLLVRLGYYDQAEEMIKKSLDNMILVYGDQHIKTASSFNDMGNVYKYQGQFELCLEYYKRAMLIRKKELGASHVAVAYSYMNLGLVYRRLSQLDLALESYLKALPILEKYLPKKHRTISGTFNNIAGVYYDLKEYSTSLKYNRQALVLRKMTYGEFHPYIGESYNSIGRNYQQLGRLDSARFYMQKAVDVERKVSGEKSVKLAKFYINLGDLFRDQNAIDSALFFYQQSIGANLLAFSSNDIYQPAPLKDYQDHEILYLALYKKAKMLRRKYATSNDVLDLQTSLNINLSIDSLITKIRQSRKVTEDKILLSSTAKDVYQEIVELHFQLYEEDNDQSHFRKAFYFSGKSKNIVLNEATSEVEAKQFSNLPDTLLTVETNLKADISFYKSQIIREKLKKERQDTIRLQTLENNLFTSQRKWEALIEQFESDYPNYYNLKYKTARIPIEDIQQALPERASLLEYFISDSTLFTFVVTAKDLFVHQQRKPMDLDSTIRLFQHSITNRDLESYRSYASLLYQRLIEPVKNHIVGDRLIIVPDGALWHVNFDLLLTSSQAEDYKSLDYLLNEYAVSYAYKANMLVQKSDNRNSNKEPLLAFSFSATEHDSSGDKVSMETIRNSAAEDLPGSREEVRAISNIFDGQYYYGKLANEANFKTSAPDFSILHLALHGEIDDVNPNNSKLYFTQNNDSTEDGYLYSYELYNMSLNSEMTVLSACNTGSGKLVRGEGIMSLGRAFTYAGCKSLVLTQWEVPDATTPRIMEHFYQGLKNGLNKDEALRQAKLNHLKLADKLSASPFYWGSFVLLGDSNELNLDSGGNRATYAVILLLLAFVAFLYFKNKRSTADV
ncbi:MAG: CHAT domain-containing tetratricopeptide repeat protein [Reichenbachiella sp.]|uniref:CHAT domain-containing protein n=1 Tax=Reichenbachiella sp. TaxID=2184521 RepID=UPI0032671AEA